MKRSTGMAIFYLISAVALSGLFLFKKYEDKNKPTETFKAKPASIDNHFDQASSQQTSMRPEPIAIELLSPKAYMVTGPQQQKILEKSKDYKLIEVERDIFIDYPLPFNLQSVILTGFKPLTEKIKKNTGEGIFERRALSYNLEHDIEIFTNGALIPTKNYVSESLTPNDDKFFRSDMGILLGFGEIKPKSNLTKLTIRVDFSCTEKMIQKKSVYKLALEEVNFNKELKCNMLLPQENFLTINCGE